MFGSDVAHDTAVNELPTDLLEPLASIDVQRRYVIGATKDEYLVPDEMLNDAWHFCERAEAATALTDTQREAVERLKSAVEKLGDCVQLYDYTNVVDLIERDQCWAVIRNRAGETLSTFGCSLPA